MRIKNKIIFATDLRGYKYLKSEKNDIKIINTPKLNINFLFPFKIVKLLYLIFYSYLILKKERIDKVISTGGYMSLPICVAAKLIGLKIYLLEPNFTLGRANKFYLNFSKKIICYSDKLKNYPKKFQTKIEVIRPLVFKYFYEIKKKEYSDDKKFSLLIFGGSQGANIFDNEINQVIVKVNKNTQLKFFIKQVLKTLKI